MAIVLPAVDASPNPSSSLRSVLLGGLVVIEGTMMLAQRGPNSPLAFMPIGWGQLHFIGFKMKKGCVDKKRILKSRVRIGSGARQINTERDKLKFEFGASEINFENRILSLFGRKEESEKRRSRTMMIPLNQE